MGQRGSRPGDHLQPEHAPSASSRRAGRTGARRGSASPFAGGRWRTCIIIASGPSLSRADAEAARASAHPVIAINNSHALAGCDLLYACDAQWWDRHEPDTRHIAERWTCNAAAAERYGLRAVQASYQRGLNVEPMTVNAGMNSGYQAINLAYHLGARRIILLGYDMQRTGGANHWHADHAAPFANGGDYADWRKRMGELAADLAARGVDVVNCSRQTALECFARSSIEGEL